MSEAFRQGELNRLAILMRNATGGAWAIALYNTVAVRDRVMDALRERLVPLPVFDFTFSESRANPLAYREGLPPEVAEERAIIFLYDLTRGGERVWGYLEMQREALADRPHGLVFWMTPAERGEAVREAPNFWSQRSGVFDFTISDDGALMQTRSQMAARPAQFTDPPDWERQERLYRGLLEEYEQRDDAPADTLLDLYDKLFDLHYDMGHYQEAAELAQDQLALARESENQAQVAAGLNNLGGVQQALGDLEGARASLERALALWREVFGEEHPQVATALNNLGSVQQDLGDLEGARASFERALRIFEQFLPPGHPNIEIVRGNLESLG